MHWIVAYFYRQGSECFIHLLKSFLYILKRNGPKRETLGIPGMIFLVFEVWLFLIIYCFLPLSYDENQSFEIPLKP